MEDRFLVRYWVKGSKKYLNSNKLVYNDGTYTQVSTKQLPSGEYISYILYDWNTSEIIPEQCTGLKDKNGKLIYEGDIVREFEKISVVCFGGGDYPYSFILKHPRFYRGYALLNYGYMRQEIEVIGNIHENADLLGEK